MSAAADMTLRRQTLRLAIAVSMVLSASLAAIPAQAAVPAGNGKTAVASTGPTVPSSPPPLGGTAPGGVQFASTTTPFPPGFGGSATVNSKSCGPDGTGSLTFTADGTATGGYAGPFHETGTIVISATHVVTADAQFTIASAAGAVTGTKSFNTAASPGFSTANCNFIQDNGTFLSFSSQHQQTYQATITTAQGQFSDSGTAGSTFQTSFQGAVGDPVNLWTLNAFTEGFTTSNGVVWIPAPLDHLGLTPSLSSIVAGGSQGYTATGFDQYGNSLGDVTASTTFSVVPDGSCTGAVCTASATGPHLVTGTDSGKTGTASLGVTPAPLDHLALTPASSSIAAGGSQAYITTGFDQYGNSLGDVTASTAFSIVPEGTCTGSSCTASAAGAHTVTGIDSGRTGSANLVVIAAPPMTADLGVVVAGADSGTATARYLVTVTNHGPAASAGGTLVFKMISTGTSPIGATYEPGCTSLSISATEIDISCPVQPGLPGATVSFTFRPLVLPGTTVTGSAVITESAGAIDLNSANNTDQGTLVVSADTDLALIGVPGSITVDAAGSTGAEVTYAAPTATDEPGDISAATVSCNRASGSTFAIGTTVVVCTASDADDSPAAVSASFRVTVVPDLRLSATITPSAATTGTVVTGRIALSCSASVSRAVTLTFRVDYLSPAGQAMTLTTSKVTVTLAAGQTGGPSFSFRVPRYFPRGKYSFTTTASDVTGSVSSTATFTVT